MGGVAVCPPRSSTLSRAAWRSGTATYQVTWDVPPVGAGAHAAADPALAGGDVIRHNFGWTLVTLAYLILIGLLYYFVLPAAMR